MKMLSFEELFCSECGREFLPKKEGGFFVGTTAKTLEELAVGEEIYCHCPIHGRYTMATVIEN